MNWKKNLFSYILWFVYAVTVSLGVLGVTVFLCNVIKISTWIAFGLAAGELLGVGVIVFALRNVCRENNPYEWMNSSKIWRVAEILGITLLISLGAYLRISGVADVAGVIEGDAFYEATTVAVDKSIPQVVHGATHFYLQLLHIILILFGNKTFAAVGLQIFLQLLAGLILYLAVRKLSGTISGIISLAFWMLSPYMIDAALELSPVFLFLVLYFLVLLLYGGNMQKNSKNPVLSLLIGLFAGIVSYLDVFGFTLFLFFTAVFTVEREPHDSFADSPMAKFLYLTLGGFIGFFGSVAADALSCGKQFVPVLQAWGAVYQPKNFALFALLNTGNFYVEFVILFMLLAVGIYSFWCSRCYEKQGIWIEMIVGLMILQGLQLLTANTGSGVYVYIFLTVLAGVAVELLFVANRTVAEVGIENGILSSIQAEEMGKVDDDGYEIVEIEDAEKFWEMTEDTDATGEMEVVEETKEEMQEEPRKVQFLENPLPLPKKHEPKVMDYRLTEVDDDYDFDLPVSDDDDYDV